MLPLLLKAFHYFFPFTLIAAVCAFLFRLYRREPLATEGSQSLGTWEFSPLSLGGFSYRQLALVSVIGLFLELLMIRWVSSEIRTFAYFKNFVLIACFLGFGLGGYMCRRRISLFPMLLPLLTIVLLIGLPWKPFRDTVGKLPSFLGGFSEMTFWSATARKLDALTAFGVVAAAFVIVGVFALIAFMFVPVGQLVGWYLENASRGILGYTINILGSLVGILLYTALCFLYQPPALWFVAAGLMIAVFFWKTPRFRYASAAVFLACAALAGLNIPNGATTFWSPYQKLTIKPVFDDGKLIAYQLNTNDSWFQQILNLSPQFVSDHPKLFNDVSVPWNSYNLPYHFYPDPPTVLVLGAGMGNDVAAALRNGAGRIVAVEIDPLILKLGRQLHFEKPYSSPRVRVVLDDARSYLQNDTEQFDFIVFSLLDSQTTSSHFTNIRIDNYVYTIEAIRAAKQHLRPDGLMIVKFQVETPWIAGRLYGLLQTVFGQPPLQFETDRSSYTTGGRFFICGSQDRIARALKDPALAAYVSAHGQIRMESAALTTDDWPYFYQREPGLTATVVLISVILVVLCWFFLRETGMTSRSILWHFFFLGAGFLLLEAQIVSRMALLFGTTWAVNAIVIAGLLFLIVAANVVVGFWAKIPASLGYVGIFASILMAYFVPLDKLLFHSFILKAISGTLFLCLPIFFAGIVFIRSFANYGFRGEAFGSNLLGALSGGLMESLSYWTGIRSLLILAAILYLASWFARRNPLPSAAPTENSHSAPVLSAQ